MIFYTRNYVRKRDLNLILYTKICFKKISQFFYFITARVTGTVIDLIEMTDFPKDSDSYYSEVTEVTDEPAVLETSLAYELKRELARRSLRLSVKNREACTCAGACNCTV